MFLAQKYLRTSSDVHQDHFTSRNGVILVYSERNKLQKKNKNLPRFPGSHHSSLADISQVFVNWQKRRYCKINYRSGRVEQKGWWSRSTRVSLRSLFIRTWLSSCPWNERAQRDRRGWPWPHTRSELWRGCCVGVRSGEKWDSSSRNLGKTFKKK